MLYEKCNEEGKYSMTRGMNNNIYQIISYLVFILNRYENSDKNNENFQELFEDSGWSIACIFIYILVFMKIALLDNAYLVLENAYKDDTSKYITNSKIWTILRNILYMLLLLITFLLAITKFIEYLMNKIYETKGLLNLIPIKFVINNSKLKQMYLAN